MTITTKETKSFAEAFIANEKTYLEGVDKNKSAIGDKENSFQLEVVKMGHDKLSNKSPSTDDCAHIADVIADHKIKLPVGHKCKIAATNKATVKSRFKALIWCGAHNCHGALETELAQLMKDFAARGIENKKVQTVRQTLYGNRMKSHDDKKPDAAQATAARDAVMEKAIENKVKSQTEAERVDSLSPVQQVAEAVMHAITRGTKSWSDVDKAPFAATLTAMDELAKEREVEPMPLVPDAAPADDAKDLQSFMLLAKKFGVTI